MKYALMMAILLMPFTQAVAQPYGSADRDAPGDAAVQDWLAHRSLQLDRQFLHDMLHPDADALDSPFVGIKTAADWEAARGDLRKQYLHMLGLDPLPPRSDLKAEVTGSVEGDGFVVEKVHFQSIPGLYVTGNLYRPSKMEEGERLPTILYVCGHAGMGRNGNKTAYQTNGIWFARHGYICLLVDTLQLGEIEGIHHGTYRENRWWWHSRGYTSAGVECWNGVRALDYLVTRADVDPDRLGVTGISGGGAATFWIAAADDRVKAAAPVSGMADLESYVGNRVINGHCDCMFLYNTFAWPWTGIAGLIAPRPLLFVNSDADAIFPMDANERVIARLERLYSLFGASDQVDAVISVGGHAYRQDIRRAVYEFFNREFKGNARPVTDSEVDAVAQSRPARPYPVEPERLRVFETDADLPSDALNGEIDRHFVPIARVDLPEPANFESWRDTKLAELNRVVFRNLPLAAPVGRLDRSLWTTSPQRIGDSSKTPGRLVLLVSDAQPMPEIYGTRDDDHLYQFVPRGFDSTRWTRRNPPNYVERSHALLGLTVDTARVYDVREAARSLLSNAPEGTPVVVAGHGPLGLLAAYAALQEPAIDEVLVFNPPDSHMDENASAFLNILRVVDVPEALGLLAPRPLLIQGGSQALRDRVSELYRRAGASDKLRLE